MDGAGPTAPMRGSTVPGPDRHTTRPRVSADCPGFITDLILRCGRGDEAALGRLFDLLHAPVSAALGQGRPEARDELVLDVFRRLWHHAPTFVPGEQGAVAWAMQHAAAVAQSVMVTSPAVTTAVCPAPSTVTVAFQTPVSGNR